ncbi:MAG TPA: 50S ribosomal protein L3 [Candidatus Woesearchaeota archaeon]|nr:50S ribosomal protein L3 [Candidatus Woesearchaeota archaeon]
MGHQKGKAVRPRRGSLQFAPRVRAKRIYPKIKNWPQVSETRLLGFAGYKAGMSHVIFTDNRAHTPTKGESISVPVTIIDVPKMKVAAVKLYGRNKRRQKSVLSEIWTDKLEKDLKRKISMPKKKKDTESELRKAEELIADVVDVRILVYTFPRGANHKKKPEIFEMGVGGADVKSKFEYAKTLLGTEIGVADMIKPGEQVDVISVTKGKGFQGTVKRFGVKLERKRTDRKTRGVQSIGPDVPRKVSWKVPMPGQMGFHNRYDYNKWVIQVGTDGKEITPKAGFQNYGVVKGDYMIVCGSLPGPSKRLIRGRLSVRPRKRVPTEAPKIQRISRVD